MVYKTNKASFSSISQKERKSERTMERKKERIEREIPHFQIIFKNFFRVKLANIEMIVRHFYLFSWRLVATRLKYWSQAERRQSQKPLAKVSTLWTGKLVSKERSLSFRFVVPSFSFPSFICVKHDDELNVVKVTTTLKLQNDEGRRHRNTHSNHYKFQSYRNKLSVCLLVMLLNFGPYYLIRIKFVFIIRAQIKTDYRWISKLEYLKNLKEFYEVKKSIGWKILSTYRVTQSKSDTWKLKYWLIVKVS